MTEFDSVGGGRLSEILAPNDPRAAANSTPNVQPTETSFETFSRRSGLSTESAFQRLKATSVRETDEDIEKAREKKNVFSKYILGGNSFGVFTLPGGIPFINPVKTLFSGLDWTQKNVADPLAGFGIGGIVAPFGGAITPFDKFDRVAENYRDSMRGSGGLIDTWQHAGTYNRERESLFIGEKFISSLVFDPTSYVGFGFLAKVPVVGRTAIRGGFRLTDAGRFGSVIAKPSALVGGTLDTNQLRRVELSLGALEDAYVGAFNFPFNKLGKLYTGGVTIGGKRLPILGKKSRSGAARQAGNIAYQTFSEDIVQVSGSRVDQLTVEATQSALGRQWLNDNTILTPAERRIKTSLRSEEGPDDVDILFLSVMGAAEDQNVITGPGGLQQLLVKGGNDTVKKIPLQGQGNVYSTTDLSQNFGTGAIDVGPRLPVGLSRSSPNFGLKHPNFESDVDKALYIVGNPTTKSKAHGQFMDFLTEALGPDADIPALGARMRQIVKSHAVRVLDGDDFNIPSINGAYSNAIDDTLRLRPTDIILGTPDASDVDGIRLFRGEQIPVSRDVGKPSGMVARGEIAAADLPLGPGRYMTPVRAIASDFGEVTEQILSPNARILDLEVEMTDDVINTLNQFADDYYGVGVIPDAAGADSAGEWYFRAQKESREIWSSRGAVSNPDDLDMIAMADKTLNMGLQGRGFHAIRMRDPMDEFVILDESFLFSPKLDKDVIVKNLGDEVGEAFINDASKVADLSANASIKEAMERLTNQYLDGVIGVDELADWIQRLMSNGPVTHAGHLRLVQQLQRLAARSQARTKAAISKMNAKEIGNWISKRDRERALNKIDGDRALARKGSTSGAIAQRFNDAEIKVIQNGLQRHISNPLARSVLMFFNFPLQEAMETQARIFFGQGKLGFMSDDQFQRKISYFEGIPSTIQSFELTNASRATQVLGEGHDGAFSQSIMDMLPGAETRAKVADLLSTDLGGRLDRKYSLVNLADYLRVTNELSAGARRQYLSSRIFHHQTALFAHDYPEIAKRIEGFSLDALRGSEHKAVIEDALMAFSTADVNALKSVVGDYTEARLLQADLDLVLNKSMGPNQLGVASQRELRSLVDSGNLTLENLPEVRRNVMNREWEDFKETPAGAAAVLNALNSAFSPENIARMDAKGLGMFMYRATESMHYLQRQFEGVMRATVDRIADEGMDVAAKQAEWSDVQGRMQEFVQATQPMMRTMRENFDNASRQVLDENTGFGDALFDEFSAMSSGWNTDRIRVNAYFAAERNSGSKTAFQSDSFWNGLRELRKQNFEEMNELRSIARVRMGRVEAEVKQKMGQVGPSDAAPRPAPMDLSKKTKLTPDDIAAMIGVQPENITQGLFKAAFQSKSEFVSYVQMEADNLGHVLGRNADQRIGDVMEDVLKAVGVTSRQVNAFSMKSVALEGMFDDLGRTSGVRRFGEAQSVELNRYVDELIETMEAMSPEDLAILKGKGKVQVEQAVEDMKRNFVNYDDTTHIDDVMQAFFPFWTYESRRLPYLLRQGFSTPLIWSMFMPEGKYNDATDNGYVDVAGVPWLQLNVFGGTMFNAPRRIFKAGFPPEHDQGFQGHFSNYEEHLGRFGFYFGGHIKLITDTVLPATGIGEFGELGDIAPPPVNIGLAAAEAGLGAVPGVGGMIKNIRRQMVPDRFREWQTAKILAERGYNPADVDWDTWTIQSNTPENGLTQSILEKASRRAAIHEFVQESLGNVRFRGDGEKILREDRDTIFKRFTGLTQTELDQLRNDGVDPLTVVSVPSTIQRLLSELPQAQYFSAASSLLRTGSKGDYEELNNEFWRIQRVESDRLAEVQQHDNERWLAGPDSPNGLAPSVWRDRLSKRKREKVVFFDAQRGRRRKDDVYDPLEPTTEILPDGERAQFFEVAITPEEREAKQIEFGNTILRIQHTLDTYLEEYHAIIPVDRDGDGQVDFSEYFVRRADYLDRLPPDFKSMVETEITRNNTEAEQALELMSKGALGDYWLVDDQVIEGMGIADLITDIKTKQLTQPRIAELMRNDSRYRAYTREVRLRRELMRKTNPLLDYAFNVFGFTGDSLNWLSPVAESWWREDENAPSLARFPDLR